MCGVITVAVPEVGKAVGVYIYINLKRKRVISKVKLKRLTIFIDLECQFFSHSICYFLTSALCSENGGTDTQTMIVIALKCLYEVHSQ